MRNERSYVRSIAEQGLLLYSRIGWPGTGPWPAATSFRAPNGFPAGTKSPLITPLRMAIIAAELDVRLPSSKAIIPPNTYSHDAEFGRLAISTPSYNTAVIKPVSQGEGGLDLVRLYDSRQRPAHQPRRRFAHRRGARHPPRPRRRSRARQPARHADPVAGARDRRRLQAQHVGHLHDPHRERPDDGRQGDDRHPATRSAATRSRRPTRSPAARRRTSRSACPCGGRAARFALLRGGRTSGRRFLRTGTSALLFRFVTPDGGTMLVAFRGVPRRAELSVVRHARGARTPYGARELRIRFKADRGMTLKRRIAVVAAAPLPSN
ncbi:MAG: hypothetical protein PGN13_05355 [Patulibacter minatonensis]